MLLRDWLEFRGLSVAQFADWMGVTRAAVYGWLRYRKVPADRIREIYEKTSGEVSANDWFDQDPRNTDLPVARKRVKR